MYTIGHKDSGRLGLGKGCKDAVKLTQVFRLKDYRVVNVACGLATSFAITEEGVLELKCR